MGGQKIGIIGSGQVAQTLGTGFFKHGYEVMLGSRDKSKLTDWKNSNGEKAHIGNFNEVAKFAEVVVLAVKGSSAKDALKLVEPSNLSGKTIIDATNPIANESPVNSVLKFFTDLNNSLMEQLQSEFPETNFVKAFSCIGSPFMINPDFGGVKPTMFICGNSADAKKDVSEIVELFGFDVADMGAVEAARAIEPLCMLWCIPGLKDNQWSHAFKLLRK